MDDIYQHCSVNIAAASGTGPSFGCFVTRDPASVAPCLVSIRSLDEQSLDQRKVERWARDENFAPYAILESNFNGINDLTDSIGKFHLDSRGWVKQERLLSPRILHFADKQIFWECSETAFACESTLTGSVPYGKHTILDKPIVFSGPPMFDWKSDKPGQQYDRWLRILQAFIGRNLTYPADRLPAIAGIARRVQSILCDDYISGLF
jgi:hypothetical protein